MSLMQVNSVDNIKDSDNSLVAYKKAFIENTTESDLINLIKCLRNSMVWVPMKIDEDSSKRTYFPVTILDANNVMAFPMFSNEEQFANQYDASEIQMMQVSVLDCIEYYKKSSECKKLVLDAFTLPFELSDELSDFILGMKN